MKPRLLILLALAGGLAVWMAVRPAASSVQKPVDEDDEVGEVDEGVTLRKQMLSERPLPGEEPSEEPDFSITVEVDPTQAKNRLYYYISEAHGYYVETFDIDFYYNATPKQPLGENAVPIFQQYINDYVEAGETKKGCLEVANAELARIGGRMGRSENWKAEIVDHGRARAKNPDPLPSVDRLVKCD